MILKLLDPVLVYCLFLCSFWENGECYAAACITEPRNLLSRADCLWKVLISLTVSGCPVHLGSFIQLKSCSACEIPDSWCFSELHVQMPNSTQMHLSHPCRLEASQEQQQECPGQHLNVGAHPYSRRFQMSLVRPSFMHFESFQATVVEPSFSALCVWCNTKQPSQHACCHSAVWHSRYKCPLVFTKALQAALTAKQQYALSMHG